MRKSYFTFGILIFLLLLVAPQNHSLQAQTEDISHKVAGHWEGAIELPGMKLEVLVDFKLTAEKKLEGVISIPVQKAKDLPLENIKAEAGEITFAIAGVPGNPVFKGKLDESGQKMTGTFSQSGQNFPFTLNKGENPVAKARKALEGIDEVINKALTDLKVPG
ncbi:MAG: serine hydrolase, partial [Candidatus Saccharicenans sp.]|nr:serine hydrolase [Candidatus Saccharicenans sp.]